MTYLDYSATTPVNEEVLKTFNEVSKKFFANPNSLHKLGVEASQLIDASTEQIASLLHVNPKEIIYTPDASEANNMALKGIAFKYQNRGKHIISTQFEHSSIYGALSYLQNNGFTIDFVETDDQGKVDIEHLKSLLTDDTILVSIGAVNSEIGIIQPIQEIGKLLNNYPKCFFHVDMTQALGKMPISLENIDLASFSAHKIFGIRGISMLYKKEKIALEPLVHGGKSTTIYRSGTPTTALIASFAKAMRLALTDLEAKSNKIKALSEMIKKGLQKYPDVYINSTEQCVPNILNISVINVKPETLLHALEEYDIYISTQTACASKSTVSRAVLALTKDEKRASSSVRISLSYITTEEEIKYFLECFDKCYHALKMEEL